MEPLIESIKEATLAATGAGEVGELAIRRQTETFSGALTALKNRGANLFDELATKITGTGRLTSIINELRAVLDSPLAADTVDAVAGGINAMLVFARRAWPYVLLLTSSVRDGFAEAKPFIDDAVASFEAMSGATGNADDLKAVVRGLGLAIGFLVGKAAAAAVQFGMFVNILVQSVTMTGEMAVMAWDLGSAIVNGIVEGITSGASKVVSAISTVAKGAVTSAKKVLKIQSPSLVFRDIGQRVMQGLGLGVGDEAPQVDQRVTDAVAFAPAAAIPGASTGAVSARGPVVHVTFTGDFHLHGVASDEGAAQRIIDLVVDAFRAQPELLGV